MKSKNISVLVLSITLILVGLILVTSFGLSKRNPGSELITFTGDLAGSQEVVGCCPNAGPNPIYTMTLSGEFQGEFRGEHTGYIFMNSFGRNMDWDYKVQFWWWTEDGTEYFIEIRGGKAHKDKRTKILTVTFENVPSYEIWIDWDEQQPVTVSFTLTREPHHPANK